MFQGRTLGQKALIVGVTLFPTLLFYVPGWLSEGFIAEHEEIALSLILLILGVYAASLGIVLYWLRENARLLYGLVEVAFALVFIEVIMANFILGHDQATIKDGFERLVMTAGGTAQLAGGLYVFVRGLDNIGQGLKPFPRADRVWQYLSMKRLAEKQADGGVSP
ncbi:hypothetical protein [Rhizobium leguminosarum]|uniref:hypothetical protein n=1 Tax=Rhizobium leguminosarum TaxID=384 RepID=UPI0012F9EAA9|nr:hypothetical protein [Rhizobium leguminosarum]MVO95111.1 hypothetical protein [Rhizobium leguminosarum bv. phaseoli]